MENTTLDFVDHDKKIIDLVDRDIRNAINLEQLYIQLGGNIELIKVADRTKGAAGLNTVFHSVTSNLVLTISRILDHPEDDVACLKKLVRSVNNNKEFYIGRAKQWPMPNDYMRVKEQIDLAVKINKGMNKRKIQAIRDFRDTYLGHTLTAEPEFVAEHRFINEILSDILKIFSAVYFVIKEKEFDVQTIRKNRQKDVKDFIETLIFGFKYEENFLANN